MYVCKFIEVVLVYIGVSKVDVVLYFMGVIFSWKVVKGGWVYDFNDGGFYNVGSFLISSIDVFVGIVGGNQGLVNCYYFSFVFICDDVNGFYLGYMWGWYGFYGVFDYIDDFNLSVVYEGSYCYSIWFMVDQIVGYGCFVYGVNICWLLS